MIKPLKMVAWVALSAAGCAGPLMKTGVERRVAPPEQALVTVLPSWGGSDETSFELWDRTRLLGVLEPGTYLQVQLEPGDHLLMAYSEEWSYVKASVVPGRHYFIEAQILPGTFRSSVTLEPMSKRDLEHEERRRKLTLAMRKLTPVAPVEKRVDRYVITREAAARKAVSVFESGSINHKLLEYDDTW